MSGLCSHPCLLGARAVNPGKPTVHCTRLVCVCLPNTRKNCLFDASFLPPTDLGPKIVAHVRFHPFFVVAQSEDHICQRPCVRVGLTGNIHTWSVRWPFPERGHHPRDWETATAGTEGAPCVDAKSGQDNVRRDRRRQFPPSARGSPAGSHKRSLLLLTKFHLQVCTYVLTCCSMDIFCVFVNIN